EVELLLQVNEGSQEGVLELEPADDAADRVWPDVGDAAVNEELDPRWLHPVHGQADLQAEEPAKPTGNPFDRVKVRPGREHVERHHFALHALGTRAPEGDPVHEFFNLERRADEGGEVTPLE